MNGRESMTSDRKARGHQTQWAAQFAVASELCKRGYEVRLRLDRSPSSSSSGRKPVCLPK
jgi:hypothetical protein